MRRGSAVFAWMLPVFLTIASSTPTRATDSPSSRQPAFVPDAVEVGGPAVQPGNPATQVPVFFIANQGQADGRARFYAQAQGYTLWLTENALVLDALRWRGRSTTEVSRDVSRLLFVNSNDKPHIVPVGETELRLNYFRGRNRSRWASGVPTSDAVLYEDLYDNIDLKVHGIGREVEYEWIVGPGEDPETILFELDGVESSTIDRDGNLVAETGSGAVVHKRPLAYQEISGVRVPVDTSFTRISTNRYGFSVGDFDRGCELVIDPFLAVYSTFLGGNDNEIGYGIAVDAGGVVHVTGMTASTNFPVAGEYQTDQVDFDVFVTKIDTTLTGLASLKYSTYIGGSAKDYGYDIAVDDDGYVYVAGNTYSSDYPTVNQYQTVQGNGDAVLTKLDTRVTGLSGLLYSTYLGGSGSDSARAIAVGASQRAHVSGDTSSTDFPTLNHYQADQGGSDAFVAVVDTTKQGAASLASDLR
jgi:hypothetical protein